MFYQLNLFRTNLYISRRIMAGITGIELFNYFYALLVQAFLQGYWSKGVVYITNLYLLHAAYSKVVMDTPEKVESYFEILSHSIDNYEETIETGIEQFVNGEGTDFYFGAEKATVIELFSQKELLEEAEFELQDNYHVTTSLVPASCPDFDDVLLD